MRDLRADALEYFIDRVGIASEHPGNIFSEQPIIERFATRDEISKRSFPMELNLCSQEKKKKIAFTGE